MRIRSIETLSSWKRLRRSFIFIAKTMGKSRSKWGRTRLAPAEIPLLAEREADTYEIEVNGGPVSVAAVSMGNPHAVLRVRDYRPGAGRRAGPLIGKHWRFPQGANVGFMQIIDAGHIRLRVFERGAGETPACGTGACAAVVAGRRLGLLDPEVNVVLAGGQLTLRWQGTGQGGTDDWAPRRRCSMARA